MAITDEEEQAFKQVEGDTIEISSDKTEYEIIIIEPGFNFWLQSVARPEGYYSQSFLEARNQIWVINWNQRVLQPQQFNPNLYELQIDHRPHIDYSLQQNLESQPPWTRLGKKSLTKSRHRTRYPKRLDG